MATSGPAGQPKEESYGEAQYDFIPEGGKSQKLGFKKGDVIRIQYHKIGEGWWWGTVYKRASGEAPDKDPGYFPAKYVKIIPKPQDDEKTPEKAFSITDRVQIVGLEKKFPRFDGQNGIITNLQKGLWEVKLPGLDNCIVRVRSSNLAKAEGNGSSLPRVPHTPVPARPTQTPRKETNQAGAAKQVSADQRLLDLETENRALKLKLMQIESEQGKLQEELKTTNTGDAAIASAITQGSGWDRGVIDELSGFLRRASIQKESHKVISESLNADKTDFDIKRENEAVLQFVDTKKIGSLKFDTSKLKVPSGVLKDHLSKRRSFASVERVKKWVSSSRGGVTGCCQELWQNLMDETIQSDVESLQKLLVKSPIDDSSLADLFQQNIANPLFPLFTSTTEEQLKSQSNLVQTCLRKIAVCNKKAGEERGKKTADSFKEARKLDSEAQEERLKLLKYVRHYKNIIAGSVEIQIAAELKQRHQKTKSGIEKLMSVFHETKRNCTEDLDEVERQLYKINQDHTQTTDNDRKHVLNFQRFLDADKKQRQENYDQLKVILDKEQKRQENFLEFSFAELVRRQEHLVCRKAVEDFVLAANRHTELINKRMSYLGDGGAFLSKAGSMFSGFVSQSLHIVETQLKNIDRNKSMLEELYRQEYDGLRSSVKAQETKLRENLARIKVRIKKKQKELDEAIAAEDVDDIEECEAAIKNYRKRDTKMEAELEEILKIMGTITIDFR